MKTKNRLLLTSAMMLALVAVSGTTATYAWWTTTLALDASLNTVTAATDASLSLTMSAVYNCSVDTNKITPTGKLTDVTSVNGESFKKAALDSAGAVTSLKDAPLDNAKPYATGVYYAVRFSAAISMPKLAEGLTYNVYLGEVDADTKIITDYTTKKTVRMAVSDRTTQFVLGNEGTGKCHQTESAYTTHTNYRNLSDTEKPVVKQQSATAESDLNKDTLCLGHLQGVAGETPDVLNIDFTLWFEGALTEKTVENTDKFESNLYIYAVRVAA